MSTQQQIRHRLRSVNNILHITQAMEIVASVQFRKLLQRMEHFRVYEGRLSEIIGRLHSAGDAQHPLFQQRPRNRIGVVVIAGDKGLCGSYNEHAFKEAENLLKSLPKEQVELILYGKKAVERFAKCEWHVLQSHADYARKLTEENIREWSAELIAGFEGGQYDELWFVYTHFGNVLSREPRVEKVLPLEKQKQAETEPHIADFIFEPAPEYIYQRIIPYFFYARLQSRLLESYASELASRMIAMKSAAKNAEEMIEKLTLIMNKNRQLSITNEILEITAGAESLR